MKTYITSLVFLLFVINLSANQITYTVTKVIDDPDDTHTLAGAILDANLQSLQNNGFTFLIQFNLEDCGASCVITAGDVYNITASNLIIDGTTQPNNNPMNGIVEIRWEGGTGTLFNIMSDNVTIKGLNLYPSSSFEGTAIQVADGNNNHILENYIGVQQGFENGIYIAGNSASNLIQFNQIANNGNGLFAENSGTQRFNSILDNSFYCNGTGIDLQGSNEDIDPPVINEITRTTVSGTAPDFTLIEVYQDDDTGCMGVDCQGKTLLGKALSNSGGDWSIQLPFVYQQMNRALTVTATATDEDGNTSEFADCETLRFETCTNALEIPLDDDICGRNSILEDLNSVTSSQSSPIGSCASTYVSKSLWFKVQVPASGNLMVRSQAGTTINPVIEAYSSCSLSLIKCQDLTEDPGAIFLEGLSNVSYVYFRVWDKNNTVVSSNSNALVELSAHALPTNKADWEWCEFPYSNRLDDESELQSGRRKANQFIIEYQPDATPTAIQNLENMLLAENATKVKECDCNNANIQIWQENDPIEMERCKKSVARQRPRASGTNYNYILEDFECKEVVTTSINTIDFDDRGYSSTFGNYYEFSFQSTNQELQGYFIDNGGNGFAESGYFTGRHFNIIVVGNFVQGNIVGNAYDKAGQLLTTFTGTAPVNTSNTSIKIILNLVSSIDRNRILDCRTDGKTLPYIPSELTTTEGLTTKVAILDTGVDLNNPAWLNDNSTNIVLWQNAMQGGCVAGDVNGYDFFNSTPTMNDPIPDDLSSDGHGTAVTGMIRSDFPKEVNEVLGSNYANLDLDIITLKISELNRGTVFDALCAIYYALENNAQVMNMSWGFRPQEYPSVLANAMQEVSCAQIPVITSAGNNPAINLDEVDKFPASFPFSNIITVAALSYTEDGGNYNFELADFASFGSNSVDIGAPGIVRTVKVGTNPQTSTGIEAGSSFSAPIVTRVAAVIKALFPNLSATQIKNSIITGASSSSELSNAIANGKVMPLQKVDNLDRVDLSPMLLQAEALATLDCATGDFPVIITNLTQQHIANEKCFNQMGAIDLFVTNLTNPTYRWSNGATSEDISGLAAGCYTIEVTNNNGCSTTASFTVEQDCIVELATKVFLQGAYVNATQRMNTNLLDNAPTLLPSTNPYTTDGEESFSFANLPTGISDEDKPVDWVRVQLRDKDNPSLVVAEVSALLQADGDVVDSELIGGAFQAVQFKNVEAGTYYVAVLHRNSLGVMTGSPVIFSPK